MDPNPPSFTPTPLTTISTSSLGKSRSGARSSESSPSPTSPTLKRSKSHHPHTIHHTPTSTATFALDSVASTSSSTDSSTLLQQDAGRQPGDNPIDNPPAASAKSGPQASQTPPRRPNRTRVRQVKHLQNEQQRRLFINNRIWELGDLLPNIPAHARFDKSGNQKPLTKIYILNKVISFVRKAMEYPPIVAYFQEQMQIEDLKELGVESTIGGISGRSSINTSGRVGHMPSDTAAGTVFSPADNHPAFSSSLPRSISCGTNMHGPTGEDEGGDDDDDGDELASSPANLPSGVALSSGQPSCIGMISRSASLPTPGSIPSAPLMAFSSSSTGAATLPPHHPLYHQDQQQQQHQHGVRSNATIKQETIELELVKTEDESSDHIGPIFASTAAGYTLATPRRHSTGYGPLFGTVSPRQPEKQSQSLGAQQATEAAIASMTGSSSRMQSVSSHDYRQESDFFSAVIPTKAASPSSESEVAQPRSQSSSKSPSVLVQSLSLSTPVHASASIPLQQPPHLHHHPHLQALASSPSQSQSQPQRPMQPPQPQQNQLSLHQSSFISQYDAFLGASPSAWNFASPAEAHFQPLSTERTANPTSTSSATGIMNTAVSAVNTNPSHVASALPIQQPASGVAGSPFEQQALAQQQQKQQLQEEEQQLQQQQQCSLIQPGFQTPQSQLLVLGPGHAMTSGIHPNQQQQQQQHQYHHQQQQTPVLPQKHLQHHYQTQQLLQTHPHPPQYSQQQQQQQGQYQQAMTMNPLSLGGVQVQLTQPQQPQQPHQQILQGYQAIQQPPTSISSSVADDIYPTPSFQVAVEARLSVVGTVAGSVVAGWPNTGNFPSPYGQGTAVATVTHGSTTSSSSTPAPPDTHPGHPT